MRPDLIERLRMLMENGELEEVLAHTAPPWNTADPYAPELVDMHAVALARKGELVKAVAALDEFASTGAPTFYTYYRLAEFNRGLGNLDRTQHYYRLAHAKFGWEESLERGYRFTHDYFSPNIPFWNHLFAKHIQSGPIRVLEIGSWQGGSATWLLDKIISQRGGSLTCIDAFEGSSEHVEIMNSLGEGLVDIFDRNIRLTKRGNLVRKLVGYSQQVLPALFGEKFDFIYIDGAHEAKYVIQDAVYCWNLVEPGGFILFDDVDFKYENNPEQDTRLAIDFFLSVFAADLEVVERRHQILIKRSS